MKKEYILLFMFEKQQRRARIVNVNEQAAKDVISRAFPGSADIEVVGIRTCPYLSSIK